MFVNKIQVEKKSSPYRGKDEVMEFFMNQKNLKSQRKVVGTFRINSKNQINNSSSYRKSRSILMSVLENLQRC